MQAKEQKDYYRQAFEAISGKLSPRRWRQIRREIENSGLIVNLKNIQTYAVLKVKNPRTVVTKSALKVFNQFQDNYSNYQELSGELILSILREIKPHVTDRMLLNAFYKARIQFRKQNVYSFQEASKVVFLTAISRNK
ncbi:hypothetical protein ANSO36C_68350 (plasmid) [Nostoc cf. commune SO-36]|uniref:Uncharacterized protein n=1 Tax=Nostoc cf. commune SO-36 TaxID=449208 RepID=A0ABM7ZCK4_NOSCO|nr:hypothetical protein [Nostoc commune]BDI21033.1 hypothetical protein ANSO36C_68350 [Nostoc cf. commune SO-36]